MLPNRESLIAPPTMLKPRSSRLWSLNRTLRTENESAVVADSPPDLGLDLDDVSMTGQPVTWKPFASARWL